MRVCPKCEAINIGTSYCPHCEPDKIPKEIFKPKDEISELVEFSVYAKEVWNAAIEAAAMQAAHCIGTETLLATHTSMEIRKLKK